MTNQRAWNKGKIVGPKPALSPDQVQAIRLVLAERGGWLRDRVLFALAIDSSLRGCDLLQLRVSDVQSAGAIKTEIRVQPSKTKASTGQVVVFPIKSDTQKLLARHIEIDDLMSTDFLFTGARGGRERNKPISERAYLKLVKSWVALIGLDPATYGTHSLRRSRPAYLYRKTGQLRACQLMLGHSSITTTQRYLGIEEAETLELARQYEL